MKRRFVLNLILVAVLVLTILPAVVMLPIVTQKWTAEATNPITAN